MKSKLLSEVSLELLKNSFTVKHFSGCFDLLARKGSFMLLMKIVEDANSVSEDVADQIKRVSGGIGAIPLVISEKAGSILRESVVYSRYGIYVVNLKTFIDTMNNKFPFVLSRKSGLTAKIVSNNLNKKMEENNVSLGSLSRDLGISSRMVMKYKKGDSEISLQKALKLYQVFGSEVFEPVNLFLQFEGNFGACFSKMGLKFGDLGFIAIETRKVPFDIVAKKDGDVILTKVGDVVRRNFNDLSKLVEANNLVIFSKRKPRDFPALSREEFLDFEDSEELIKFLKEFEM